MRSFVLLLLVCICVGPAGAQPVVRPAFPYLSFSAPVDIQVAPTGNSLYVVEQAGRILRVAEADTAAAFAVFLDIADRVVSGGERGLLGMAFHPRFPDSAYVYVNYTTPGPLRTVISRFTVEDAVALPASETVLLTVAQPYTNHNAGQLQFGPDGYLYASLGDGGSAGDPEENGQNPATLLGSILRLDVDGGGHAPDCAPGGQYTIPVDNPFVGSAGACDEIYAYGFRNPWRFSFSPDGTLFVADVGQSRREEVNVVTAGGNYGWDVLEGSLCYEPAQGCSATGTVLPVAEYAHDASGGFSITGGYVYTGTEPGCAALQGRYVYGDYVSGNLWSLAYDGTTADVHPLAQNIGLNVSTFGVGRTGILYLADHGGTIYRLDCAALATSTSTPGQETGALTLSPPVPSPAHHTARLVLTGPPGTWTLVRVYDLLGRAVTTLFEGTLSAPTVDLILDARALPAGRYLVQAQNVTQRVSQAVTIVR